MPEEGLLANETVGWTCFRERRWDPHVEACIRRHLRPGQTGIDVGANLGYMTGVMAQSVGPAGRVWAFEPVAETFGLLELRRSLNGFPQVALVRAALGAAQGTAEITFDARHSGIATLHPEQVSGAVQEIEIRALDAMVAAGEVGRPDLVKVDVEGHEYEALRGARDILGETRPTVVLEYKVRAATAAGWTLADAAELLRAAGDYRFFLIDGDGEHPFDPFAFRLERDERLDPHVDVLARPADATA